MRWRVVWLRVAAVGLGCGLVCAQQWVEMHHASLMVQTGQSESVTSLAFLPDGHAAVVVVPGGFEWAWRGAKRCDKRWENQMPSAILAPLEW